jgi:MFS family permease
LVCQSFQHQALYIILVIGASNALGRVSLGFIADHWCVLRVLQLSCLVVGLSTPFWYFCDKVWELCVYGGFYGFAAGSFVGLVPPLLAAYFPNNVSVMIGLIATITGVGVLIGTSVGATFIFTVENPFLWVIMFSSGSIMIGFFICLWLPRPNTFAWVDWGESTEAVYVQWSRVQSSMQQSCCPLCT